MQNMRITISGTTNLPSIAISRQNNSPTVTGTKFKVIVVQITQSEVQQLLSSK